MGPTATPDSKAGCGWACLRAISRLTGEGADLSFALPDQKDVDLRPTKRSAGSFRCVCEVLLPIDPILGSTGKAALAPAIRGVWKTLRVQIDRRGDVNIDDLRGALAGSHYDEAIEVLLAEGGIENVSQSIKAFLSDRPPIFDEAESRDWLRTDEAKALVRRAVEALIDDHEIDEEVEAAAELFERLFGGFGWRGGDLLVQAAGFVAKSIFPQLSLDTRVILDATRRQFAGLSSQVAGVDERVAELGDAIKRIDANIGSAVAPQIRASPEAVDFFLQTELKKQRRRLALDQDLRAEPASQLAARAWDGDLSAASARTRALAFRRASSYHSRYDEPDLAQLWLDRAASFGVNDLVAEQARILGARDRTTDALRLLDGRRDPESVAASLNAMNRRDGQASALEFLEATYSQTDLSGHTLAQIALWFAEADNLERGEALLSAATEDQVDDNPVLLLTRARFRLALCASGPRAAEIAKNLSVLPLPAMLRDDSAAVSLVTKARADMKQLRRLAREFADSDFLNLLEEIEVYLEALLRRWSGEEQTPLRELVSSPDTVVRFAPLATMFGVTYDRALLDGRLAHARRLGSFDLIHLRAAFDVLFAATDFAGLADFIDKNREQLQGLFAQNHLIGLEVESLARSGRVSEAKALLNRSASELDTDDQRRFRDIIAEEEGEDALSVRRSRFIQTSDDHDLELLVQAALEKDDLPTLVEYTPELWRRRRRLRDARLAADQLLRAGRDDELTAFISELGDAVAEDDRLRLHAAWVSFRAGDIQTAQKHLRKLLQQDTADENVRSLNLQLHIEMGDWEGLGALLHQDLERAAARTSVQLLQAAGIAAAIRHADAFDLAKAAVEKANDDPHLLMNAYFIALQLGREDSETGEWFQRAVKVSGEDGPLKHMKSADLPIVVAEGRERSSNVNSMLMRGELPIALAVRPLNLTVSGLLLESLRANEQERDARRRVALPLFAGNRLEFDLARFSRPIFDHTSVLVLHFLGLLPQAIEAFDKIIIPAGLMSALMTDLSKIRSGQFSRAIRASALRALVEKKRLTVISNDEARAAHEGFDDELNLLAGEASRVGGTIIHTYPIYEPASFMERVSDPAPIMHQLASPRGLVMALAKSGAINAIEEERALRLPGFAKTWPEETAIDLSKPILLDGLAVTYLSDAEILEPLLRSGRDVRITDAVLEIGAAEIEQHENAEQVARGIDDVRRTLASALASGNAALGAVRRGQDEGARDALPLMNALADVGDADLVVCDDRMINRNGLFMDNRGNEIPTATSLDVVNLLASKAVINEGQRRAARERLRVAGAALMPVTEEEIVSAALRSDWSLGAPREVAAIKDSIQLVLLREMLQLPAEAHWLASLILHVSRSIREIWAKAETSVAVPAATYLYQCVPHQETAHLPGVAQAWDGHPAAGRLPIAAMLAGSFDVPEGHGEQYGDWLNHVVMDELEAIDPALIDSIAESLKPILLDLPFDDSEIRADDDEKDQ